MACLQSFERLIFRYDYLEFTDSKGCRRRFDQKVATEKWPLVSSLD